MGMNTLLENIRASAILMKNLPSTLSGDALLISREEARRIGYELEACAEKMEQAARAASPKAAQSCACSREITTGWTADNGIPLCNVCGRVDVNAAFEMAKEPPKVSKVVERAEIEKALRRAFNLGQTYWQQADSESYSQNRKSDETLQKFNTLVVETSNKFSGMALVPVDDLDAIAEVVRGMLHTAYQNAMPVCCGKPGQQCCGNPDPEWNAADIEVMDSLGPVEKRISAMLATTKEKGE